MNKKPLSAFSALLFASGCAGSTMNGSNAASTATPDNPFYADAWDTAYGAPPFEQISEASYAAALDEGMKRQTAEVAAIAGSSDVPTFANTVEALERSGAMLDRTASVFFNLASSSSNDEMQKLREQFAPKLSKHSDSIFLDGKLWERVKNIYDGRDGAGLNPEQQKLLADYHRDFIAAGANLPADKKKTLTEINAELAGLYSKFGDAIRLENEHYALVIDKKEDLAGLPDEVVAAGAEAGKQKKQEGKWAFTLVRSSITPFLMYANNRALRKEIYTAYTTRGAHQDERDTREMIKKITRLRARRAELLGFKSHAHYQTDKNMAKTPDAVFELLNQVFAGAQKLAMKERTMLTAELQKELGKEAKLEPWDWWYYAEKVRKARFDLSQDELKPYFQVDAVRKGAFETASRLWGIKFEEVTDSVPRYHKEVKAFDVKEADGTHIGLLYVDYHPRTGKRGGAWMSEFRGQSKMDGNVRPVIVNVGNFPAPAGDKPALLGWDEVETLFHEFGHALHGLLSNVTYESLSGTNVKRDYVEFPSQLLENWASHPSVIKSYAVHYETKEPIPDALVEKIQKAANFNQGFAMTELAVAALLDLEWHTKNLEETEKITDVLAFDREAAKKLGLIPEIAPRYHSPYFQHIFAGDGYSAGYYVYLWAQVLEADAFQAFEEKGNVFDPELAKKLRKFIFEAGSSDEEMKLYSEFRGRAPRVEALLEKRGLKN